MIDNEPGKTQFSAVVNFNNFKSATLKYQTECLLFLSHLCNTSNIKLLEVFQKTKYSLRF